MADKIRGNVLVSIVFFAENVPLQIIEYNLKNLTEQLYANKEVVVFYDENRQDFDNVINNYSIRNCKFIPTKLGLDSCKLIKDSINGEVIFYKTCSSIEWMPRHIDVHLEIYNQRRINWVQSLVEIRDLSRSNSPMNIIDWKTKNSKSEELEFDEISHTFSVNINWEKIFEKGFLDRKEFFKQLGNGEIANEISVLKWLNTTENQKQSIIPQIGIPIEQTLLPNHFPTLLGNFYQNERNKKILKDLENVDANSINSIVVKRLLGMGDVILTEPIRRYLKNKYPNSKITLMTTKSRGCDQISSYLGYDNVIFVDESEMLMDTLSKVIEDEEIVEDENGLFDVKKIVKYNFNDYQIKIDLDLSYESRLLKPYLVSYFEMIGVDYKSLSQEEKLYKIYYTKDVEKKNNGIYLCGEGSGWPGKTYPYMPDIKKFLEEKQQFEITEFSYQDKIEDLFDILLSNNYYLGTDSGVMHIALALGLKGIVICGAAVTELTTPYVEYGFCNSIHVEEKDLNCIGCKHKMFFELLNNNQITFVSPCKHPSGQPVCMVELKPELLYDIIIDKLK